MHRADGSPSVSVVAVSWQSRECLPAALDSVPTACAPRSYEIVVVDNGSTDGSQALLRDRGDVRLIELPENTGFTHAANLGASEATGTFLLFLNPDVVLPPGSIASLADALDRHPQAWAATPWFLNPDGSTQRFWRRLPSAVSAFFCFTHRGRRLDRVAGRPAERRHRYERLSRPLQPLPIDGVGAACLLVRRDDFAAASGFDERYFNFFQDTDLQRRMRRAGKVLLGVAPVAVTHGFGITFRKLAPQDVHGQFLYAFRQYLAGEPWHRRLAGELAVRIEMLGRGRDWAEVRRRSLAPLDPGRERRVIG